MGNKKNMHAMKIKKYPIKKLLRKTIILVFIIHALNLIIRLPQIINDNDYSGLLTLKGLIIAIILCLTVSLFQLKKTSNDLHNAEQSHSGKAKS